MKPILYPANETQFESNGLGRLADAVSCVVTEERNGSYELAMQYPVDGIHFEDIAYSRIICARPADGKDPQPFRIYRISKSLGGLVEINAEHISYQLNNIPVSPFKTSTVAAALAGLASNAAEACPFTFWTDKTTTATFKVDVPTSIRSLLGGMQGSVLDTFGGGEYEFDRYTVKLHSSRGYNRGVTLRYGKNIIDIKQEENIASTHTGVMPYWRGSEDDGTEVTVMLSEKVLHSANASNFPYQRTIPLDLSSEFESKPTQAQLRTRAKTYMTANAIGVPAIDIDLSFVALWQTEEYADIANLERVNLCDRVTVKFEALGISAEAKVVKTEYNVLLERYNKIELGDVKKTSLSSSIRSDISGSTLQATKTLTTKSYLKKAIDYASSLIRGGLGGHVVMSTDANGKPTEILIMDTEDTGTAVKVLRINQNGIGFSTQGYAGPFTTAWTIDGHFVADFIDTGNLNASLITTGTLLASLIKTGKIESNNGCVYFDLDNNEIACSKLVAPTPWNYATSKDPGDPVISVDKGTYGSSSNPNYYARIRMYIDGNKNYGINVMLPKDSSNTDSTLYTRGKLNLAALASSTNTNYPVSDSKTCLQLGQDFFLAAGASSGSTGKAYINGLDSGTIIFYAADGYEFYGGSGVTFHNNVISQGFKSRLANTENYGEKLLYCYEMPSPMFGDVGEGIIEDDGSTVISIDDIFDETTRTDIEYHVFLQTEGKGEAYVSKKRNNYFIVEGTPGLNFSWEVKARQKGYETERLESMEERVELEEVDYESGYINEYNNLIAEQEDALYETA